MFKSLVNDEPSYHTAVTPGLRRAAAAAEVCPHSAAWEQKSAPLPPEEPLCLHAANPLAHCNTHQQSDTPSTMLSALFWINMKRIQIYTAKNIRKYILQHSLVELKLLALDEPHTKQEENQQPVIKHANIYQEKWTF